MIRVNLTPGVAKLAQQRCGKAGSNFLIHGRDIVTCKRAISRAALDPDLCAEDQAWIADLF
jgi:hypothetical protein